MDGHDNDSVMTTQTIQLKKAIGKDTYLCTPTCASTGPLKWQLQHPVQKLVHQGTVCQVTLLVPLLY